MGSGITPSPPEPGIETVILRQTLTFAVGLALSVQHAWCAVRTHRVA